MPSLGRLAKNRLFLFLLALIAGLMGGCTTETSVLRSDNPVASTTESEDQTSLEQFVVASGTGVVPTNQKPLLTLRSSDSLVGFGNSLTLVAEAVDPDGDPLYYHWNASEGTFISQTGNRATWKAPEKTSEVELTCQVEDHKGGVADGKIKISVVGGRTYVLQLTMSRTSLLSGSRGEGVSGEWMPVPQARVAFPGLKQVLVSDQEGKVTVDLDAGATLASQTEVQVQYLEWEVRFQTTFSASERLKTDQIQFFPGYDGMSIAMARGDSFASRKGGIEVTAVEQKNGQVELVREFVVEAGASKQTSETGRAFLAASIGGGEVSFKLTKPGYADLTGVTIPVALDGVTLVMAAVRPAGKVPTGEAFISWTRPYNGERAVAVTGPLQIGFGQPMEQATVFDDIEMTIQESGGNTAVLRGPDILRRFSLDWAGPAHLRLYPKNPLGALKRYSVLVTRWNARAADGRLLKNYGGMFGVFTTDVDPSPGISATSPRNGDTGVGRSGPFVIRFDRAMDPRSLTAGLTMEITNLGTGSLVRVDGTSFAKEFSAVWSEGNTLLSLVPRRTLKAGTSYLVRLLATGLTSESGKRVEGFDHIWGQFTTGEL